MMEAGEVIVVKLGGAAGEDAAVLAALTAEIAALVARGAQLVLVHGGGGEVSELTRRLGLQPQFAAGVRVTSAAEMPYVDMVLCGAVNKRLVRACAAAGLRAVGLSGADGPIFTGVRLADEPGERIFARSHTARVAAVDTRLLRLLLAAGYLPVVAPTSLEPPARPVNINADAVALRIAPALAADRLLFLSDVPGVLKAGRVLAALTPGPGRGRDRRRRHPRWHDPQDRGRGARPRAGGEAGGDRPVFANRSTRRGGGLAGLLTGAAGTTILAQSSPPTQLEEPRCNETVQ